MGYFASDFKWLLEQGLKPEKSMYIPNDELKQILTNHLNLSNSHIN